MPVTPGVGVETALVPVFLVFVPVPEEPAVPVLLAIMLATKSLAVVSVGVTGVPFKILAIWASYWLCVISPESNLDCNAFPAASCASVNAVPLLESVV